MSVKAKTKTANQWLRGGRIVRNDAEPCGFKPKAVFEQWQTMVVDVAHDAYSDSIVALLIDSGCYFRADTGDRLFFEVETQNRKEIKQLLQRFELPWKRYIGKQIAISTQLKPS